MVSSKCQNSGREVSGSLGLSHDVRLLLGPLRDCAQHTKSPSANRIR